MAVDDSYTKALLHFDASPITEESGKTVTNTNVSITPPSSPAIPTMTADNAPSPFAVSVNYAIIAAGYEAYKAFDGSLSTLLHSASGVTSGIVTMVLDGDYAVTSYKIIPQSGYTTRSPKNWTLEGSNNGTDWTVVDTRTNVTSWVDAGAIFAFSNSTAYSYYRINITATNDASYLVFTEIQLYSTVSSNFGDRAYFSSGAFLTLADSDDWYLGDGDFTFDFRVEFPILYGYQTIFSQYTADSDWYGLTLINATTWDLTIDNAVTFNFTGDAILVDALYHVALVRNGNELKLFVNGTQYGSTANITRTIDQINGSFYIGQLKTNTYYLKAYLDEFRVSKGIARWTENFTPPTVPYRERIILATFI